MALPVCGRTNHFIKVLSFAFPTCIDIPRLLEKALKTLTNIWKVYTEGDIAVKCQIIGLIFPEKLGFDGNYYRTERINTVAHYIFQINNWIITK